MCDSTTVPKNKSCVPWFEVVRTARSWRGKRARAIVLALAGGRRNDGGRLPAMPVPRSRQFLEAAVRSGAVQGFVGSSCVTAVGLASFGVGAGRVERCINATVAGASFAHGVRIGI